MATIQRYVSLFILSGVLAIHSLSAQATNLPLPQIFIKCDGLLGKNTKSVLAALGQPDEAVVNPLDATLTWKYKVSVRGQHGYGAPVELKFFPNRTLAAVYYNGQIDGGANLVQILATCNASSLKVGYDEKLAKMQAPTAATKAQSNYGFVIKATTKNNNNFYNISGANATNALTTVHKFDATTGVYKDTFIPNPDFIISNGFTVGNIIIVTTSVNKSEKFTGICSGAGFDSIVLVSKHYILLTDKIMPWLHSSQ